MIGPLVQLAIPDEDEYARDALAARPQAEGDADPIGSPWPSEPLAISTPGSRARSRKPLALSTA